MCGLRQVTNERINQNKCFIWEIHFCKYDNGWIGVLIYCYSLLRKLGKLVQLTVNGDFSEKTKTETVSSTCVVTRTSSVASRQWQVWGHSWQWRKKNSNCWSVTVKESIMLTTACWSDGGNSDFYYFLILKSYLCAWWRWCPPFDSCRDCNNVPREFKGEFILVWKDCCISPSHAAHWAPQQNVTGRMICQRHYQMGVSWKGSWIALKLNSVNLIGMNIGLPA